MSSVCAIGASVPSSFFASVTTNHNKSYYYTIIALYSAKLIVSELAIVFVCDHVSILIELS